MRVETLAAVRQPTLGDARRLLREAIARGSDAVTFRAPVAPDVASFWGPDDDALLWDPPGECAFAGVGTARLFVASGPRRFGAIDPGEIAGRHSVEPGLVAPPPRLFGGFAFECGGAGSAPWKDFGDGLFVLPRWVYGLDTGGAWLRYHRSEGDPLAELEGLWRRLTHGALSRSGARIEAIEVPSSALWRREVDAIRGEIAVGRLAKAVAATRATVTFDAPLDPRLVLARLKRRFAGCTRFAIRRDGTTFLGATPERLLSRRGDVLRTEALAGSAAPGREHLLLASRKDRHEHDLVIEAIVAALAPFTTELRRPAEPRLHRLPNVVHLRTPIEGRVGETPTLRLVEALHPTPAVGGVPTSSALRLIADHEQPRGWYAAPIGWLDASGDGTFAVGLRSGVLQGRQAWAFAGCGIVAGSQPEAEFEEARLKLRAFLGALSEDG